MSLTLTGARRPRVNHGNHTLFLDHRPWNLPWFWCVLTLLALALHGVLGPAILFPVVAVIPVMLAAWHSGRRFAIALAVIIALVHWSFFFIWTPQSSLQEASVNGVVRCLMLILVALLTAHIARLHRALRHRVRTLERLLPICAFCKRIRDDQGHWKQIEVYISSHTDTQFSHGFCPECARKNYPELFPSTPELPGITQPQSPP